MELILSTPRLLLKPIVLEDADFILELVNTPLYLQFIGDRNIRTKEDAQAFITNGPQNSYDENGYGLYSVHLKETADLIGVCGLLKRDFFADPDIGFAFLPEAMGKGYAQEMAAATLEYARTTLGIKSILAFADPSNARSVKLFEEIGMKFQKYFKHPDDGKELVLYERSYH